VRNPEIFDIENIENKNESNDKKDFNDNESIILPNRSFSYNIQNILTHFYLKKMENEKSEFMKIFMKTNLYRNYLTNVKYQNDSGFKIIENIKATINDQRSIDNCFIVEYNKKLFCALPIIEQLDKILIKNKNNDDCNTQNIFLNKEDKYKTYIQLKSILIDYCFVSGINVEQKQNDYFNNEDSKRKSRISINKAKMKYFRNTGHVKRNTSLLQFTFNQNPNFNLAGIDKSSKNYFKFYGKNGFLQFLNIIDDFIREERKEIENLIFKNDIYNQLINIYKNYENIFSNSNIEKKETININIDVLDKEIEDRGTTLIVIDEKQEKNGSYYDISNDQIEEDITSNNNILEELGNLNIIRNTNNSMSMIEEKDEENNESCMAISKQNTFKSNMILNNILLKNDENIDENIINDIIVFPDFKNKKENKDCFNIFNQFHFDNNANDNKKRKNKCQYFLFLAYYLEEIESDNVLLEQFNKDLFNKASIHINIHKYILKLYKEAYIHSGENHRDFPYFTFFTFLNNLDYATLSDMENSLNELDGKYSELYEIYLYIYSQNIPKGETSINHYDYRTTEIKDRAISINNNGVFPNSIEKNFYDRDKTYRPESYNNYHIKNTLSNQGLFMNKKSPSYSPSFLDNQNFSKEYIINDSPLFEPKCKPGSTHVINEFCILLSKCFPTEIDIKTKNIQQIFDQLYVKINIQPIRELVGELKKIKLNTLNNKKEKICFWLNCFNFLLIYSIFYLKINLSKKDIWRNFFRNIKYNLGGNNFSFEDMLYILFKKNIFFPNDDYIPSEHVQANVINLSKGTDAQKDKDIYNDIKIAPFLLYLPNGQFMRPIIYNVFNLESEIKERITVFLSHFIKWNAKEEIIFVNELIVISDSSLVKKYKEFIQDSIYKIVKLKKYKRMSIIPMKWDICFNGLLGDNC
jgi:hypothetical protein